jgi:hypothetical protein
MDKVRNMFVSAAAMVALAAPLYFFVAAMGVRLGLIEWTKGWEQMTLQWGPFVLLGALGVGVLALLSAFLITPRGAFLGAIFAFLLPAAALGYGWHWRQQSAAIAPISDVSTDLEDPPLFSIAVTEARGQIPNANPLDLSARRTRDGRSFADVQREAYPDIQPISTGLPAREAYDIALDLAQDQNWDHIEADAATGRIEAWNRTFWFGFTDDIAIRVRQDGEGARIDMRGSSRLRESDYGSNAALMGPFLAELKTRIEAAEAQATPDAAAATDAQAATATDSQPPPTPTPTPPSQ